MTTQPTAQTVPDSGPSGRLHAGMRMPFTKAGESPPRMLSAEYVNTLIGMANAFSNTIIIRRPAPLDTAGNAMAGGALKLSDQNAVIELYDPPSKSGGSAFFNTVQTYTASCPGGTTGSSVTVTVAVNTIGSNVDQATANSLALELATDRANNALVCTFGTAGFDDNVYWMKALSTGEFLVGGAFTQYNGYFRPGVAVLDSILDLVPSKWLINHGTSIYTPIIHSVAEFPTGSAKGYYIAGQFEITEQGNVTQFIARLTKDGQWDSAYNYGGGVGQHGWDSLFIGPAFLSGPDATGKIVTWGSTGLTSYNGTAVNFGLVLNQDGSINTVFPFSSSAGGSFFYVDQFGTIWAVGGQGGMFGNFNGASIAGQWMFKLSSYTTRDATFNAPAFTPTGGSGAFINTMVVTSGGNVVIGGSWTTIAGNSQPNLSRLTSTGGYDATFTATVDGIVNVIAQDSGGRIIIAGDFTHVNGVATTYIARLHANGTTDTTFVTPTFTTTGANAVISAIAISPVNGSILIGCGSVNTFSVVNGKARAGHVCLLDTLGNVIGP